MPIFFPPASSLIPASAARIEDDFEYNNSLMYGRWKQTGTLGGGMSFPVVTNKNTHGIARLSVPATVGAASTLSRGLGQIILPPSSFFEILWGLQIPVLSTPTNRFTIRAGLGDSLSAADMTNGVYFEYSDNLSNGQWNACTANGGVQTKVASGKFADTNFVSLKAYAFGSAGVVIFAVNNQVIAGISTNIPAANPLTIVAGIYRVTQTAGQINTDIDYAGWYYDLPGRA